MNTSKVIIYQSLLQPLPQPLQDISIHQEFYDSQKALKNIKELNIQIQNTSSSTMQVKELKRLPNKVKQYWSLHKQHRRHEVYYKFTITVKFEDKHFEDLKMQYGENPNNFFITYVLPDEVEERFYDFLMILNICRVGGYKFGMGVIETVFGLKILNKLNFDSIALYKYSVKKRWPKFINLNIEKTWQWFLTKVNPNGIDEISSTKLSRALNAFSYLYENANDANKLFWTMVGLEAIYVNGKEGISEQIKQKGQLYLGEIEEFKKRLSKMYEFRSAFVHGSKNFPSYFHIYDGLDSYDKFNTEFFETLLTAQSMLIATLQKIANEDRNDLTFKYSLEQKS